MSTFDIWVKVITANPLKGPSEGQVQFLVEWVRRKAQHRDWVWFTYKGKRRKSALVGGYATVHENFSHTKRGLWVVWGNTGRAEDNLVFHPCPQTNASWNAAATETPPKMLKFKSYVADENGSRSIEQYHEHWNAYALIRSLIGKYFKPYYAKQARENGIDGEYPVVMVSVFRGHEAEFCDTLYVEYMGPASLHV